MRPDAGLYRTQPSQHRACEYAGTNRPREALPLVLHAEVHGPLRRSAATIYLGMHRRCAPSTGHTPVSLGGPGCVTRVQHRDQRRLRRYSLVGSRSRSRELRGRTRGISVQNVCKHECPGRGTSTYRLPVKSSESVVRPSLCPRCHRPEKPLRGPGARALPAPGQLGRRPSAAALWGVEREWRWRRAGGMRRSSRWQTPVRWRQLSQAIIFTQSR